MIATTPVTRRSQGALRSNAVQASLVLAAIASAVAVPIVWLLIGAKIQGVSGVTHMTKPAAVAMFPGVILTYFGLLAVFGRIEQKRVEAAGESGSSAGPARRAPWNRSMRDEPHKPGGDSLSPVEMAFVVVATVSTIGFNVWFFFFAGSPIG